ncbi:MAG: hypothetical protein WCT28_04085 [Patescibacteria group bacterium]|jgi:hypothetical protein
MRASPAYRANQIQENEAEKCDRLIGTRGLKRTAIEPSNPPRRIITVWRGGEWVEVGRAEVPVPVCRTPRSIQSKSIVAKVVPEAAPEAVPPIVVNQVIDLELARRERDERVEQLRRLLNLLKVCEAQLQKMADEFHPCVIACWTEENREEAEREKQDRQNERARSRHGRQTVIPCGLQHIDRELPRWSETNTKPSVVSKRKRIRSGGVPLEELLLRAARPIPSIKPLPKEEVNRQLGIQPRLARGLVASGGSIPRPTMEEPDSDASIEKRLQWRIQRLDPAAVLRVYESSRGSRWETVEQLTSAIAYHRRNLLFDLVADYVGRVEAVMKTEAERAEKAKRKGR